MKKWMTICVLLVAVGAASADDLIAGSVSQIRLRSHINAGDGPLTLGQVLDLSAADERLVAVLSEAPLTSKSEAVVAQVSHDQIVERLNALGVNAARVLLGGALTCEIIGAQPESTATETAEMSAAPASSADNLFRFTPARGTGDGATLADVVRNQLQSELGSLGGDVEVQFERGSDQYVSLTTPPYDFVVRSVGPRELGMREIRVTIRREGQTQRSVPLFVNVRLTKSVLVASGPLNAGTFVRPEDVTQEQRTFDRIEDIGLDDPSAAIGQQVESYVASGGMLRRSDLKPVDLVKRGRPVSVSGGVGGVTARITGSALDSGGYGDSIRVRLGTNRRDRREVRATVTGIGTVRLETQ